jgi:hypothetical protein
VTSTLGRGSTFKFYLKVKRAISVQDAADANAAKLEQVTLDAEAVGGEIAKAIKTLQSPNYAHKINRYDHSESSNPIVGSAAGVDVLHVLIVEDNLINQKVRPMASQDNWLLMHSLGHGYSAPQSEMRRSRCGSWRKCSHIPKEVHFRKRCRA